MTGSDETVDRALGERIKALRKSRDWTQVELSERLRERGWEIDPTGVTRLELGGRAVQVRQLYVLADVFGCTPAELLPDTTAEISALADRAIASLLGGRSQLVRAVYEISRLDSALSGPAATARDLFSNGWDDFTEMLDASLKRDGVGQVEIWKPTRAEAEQRARLYQGLISDLISDIVTVDEDAIYFPSNEEVGAAGDRVVQDEIDRRRGK